MTKPKLFEGVFASWSQKASFIQQLQSNSNTLKQDQVREKNLSLAKNGRKSRADSLLKSACWQSFFGWRFPMNLEGRDYFAAPKTIANLPIFSTCQQRRRLNWFFASFLSTNFCLQSEVFRCIFWQRNVIIEPFSICGICYDVELPNLIIIEKKPLQMVTFPFWIKQSFSFPAETDLQIMIC